MKGPRKRTEEMMYALHSPLKTTDGKNQKKVLRVGLFKKNIYSYKTYDKKIRNQ